MLQGYSLAALLGAFLAACAIPPQPGTIPGSDVAYANPRCWRTCSVNYLIVRANTDEGTFAPVITGGARTLTETDTETTTRSR